MRRALPLVAVLTVGLALVGAHAWLHPPARDFVADAPLGLAGGKLLAILQALATLVAIDLAALAIGTPLWRRLHRTPQSLVESLPPRLALGLLVLAYAVFALAALHALVEPALVALVAVPIAAAAPSFLRVLREYTRTRSSSSRPRPSRATLAVVALAALLALVPLLDAFVPQYGWDALTYHLSVPERYLHGHRIWFTPFSLYSAFPLDVEMLYALALGLGSAAVGKLINLQFGLLALWMLTLLARRVSSRAALFAVAIVVADPLFAWELRVAYNDLAGCLYALLAFAALVDGALVELALFGGACAAIRLPALLVPAAFWLLYVLRTRSLREFARASIVIALGGFVLLAPWLIRNAAFMGTLLRPTPYFDAQVVEQMVAFSRSIGVGHGLGAMVTLPWTLFVAAQPGVYSGGFGFAVGPLYLAATVAALVVPEGRGRALAAAGLLTLGWFFTSQEARYLLPALMLFALAGGIAFDALAARSRAIYLLPVAAVALTQAPLVATLPARAAVALGPLPSDDFAEREDAARLGAQLRATLPPDARVLLLLESRSFYFRGLDFIPYHVLEGSPVLRLVHDAPDAHALRCALAALGVTDVAVNLAEVRRFHPIPIPRYGPAEYAADLSRLRRFLDEWAEPFARQGAAVAAHLKAINGCTGVSSPGAALPKTH